MTRHEELRAWIAAIGSVFGAFMAFLDIQIINSSLANIDAAISATPTEGSWISTSYLIGETITMPMSVWLTSLFGTRRYLTWNTLLFVAFSISCALSSSLTAMIASRAAQGLFAGALIPGALTIVATRLPPARRPTGIALFGLTITLAPALGPTVGGWLTENWGWQFIFFINAGPGLLAALFISLGLDQEPVRYGELRYGDWLGMALTGLGLAFGTVVLEEGTRLEWFDSAQIRDFTAIAILCLGGAVVRELLTPRPFINLRLLRRRTVGLSCFLIFFVGANMFGVLYLIPVYLAQVNGYNAQQIGFVLVWSTLPQLIFYPATPILMRYVDTRILMVFGMLTFAASAYINSHLSRLVGVDQLILPQLLSAIGQPVMGVTMQYYTVVGLNNRDAADSSALWTVSRNIGGTMGVALLSTAIQRREHYHFSVVSEHITHNALATGRALSQGMLRFGTAGQDPTLAHMGALARLAGAVREQATIMAFSDSFFMLGAATLIGACFVALLPKAAVGTAPVTAAH